MNELTYGTDQETIDIMIYT